MFITVNMYTSINITLKGLYYNVKLLNKRGQIDVSKLFRAFHKHIELAMLAYIGIKM